MTPVAANLEGAVRVAFSCGEYAGFCGCAHCGTLTYCRGTNPESRICLEDFEFVFKNSFPNLRRRRHD
jgi:hypothetical protein